MNKLSELEKLSQNFAATPQMPVLFLGHGSPMNAIEENEFVQGFQNISKTLPTPNAILCISAHWYIRGTKLTAMEMPRTIYDFGGFPDELYQVKYPAKGSPELASDTQKLITSTHVDLDHEWGLDHGAWTVIKHLYPDANIPVIQMSIDRTQPASYHYELAQQLRSLRDKGVLIIGSGNIVHNLRMVDFRNAHVDNYGFDWAREVRAQVNQFMIDGDHQSLINYHKAGKAWQLAIPTPDHYLPLIYSLGLQNKNESVQLFNDKMLAGSLSMTSVKIG
ncbi:4,5-DOPA dioxygenase extradiol [bacterium SCSIO 12643]|nr:4,5-DOPA dioxygenase extradiol [bacterium SCSIO 12643]